ncbi:hypothetical protein [Methylobacter luteus]|uniref:hypothetical protein n=1 Tax=Methylobacter luteus TaxID=415 RepID=UPI00041E16BE|nr:hypothetical protein [Methylobacter luteus]
MTETVIAGPAQQNGRRAILRYQLQYYWIARSWVIRDPSLLLPRDAITVQINVLCFIRCVFADNGTTIDLMRESIASDR